MISELKGRQVDQHATIPQEEERKGRKEGDKKAEQETENKRGKEGTDLY